MKKNKLRKIFTALFAIIGILLMILVICAVRLKIKTKAISNDYTGIYQDEKYSTPIFIDDIQVITQDCFFAIGFPQNLHQNSNKFADGIPGNLHLQIC